MDLHRNQPDGKPAAATELAGVVHVGPFRILSVLGSGGMGTVYLAEQTEPVHRQVALKVLASGRTTERGIARMEAERQALALMNHPSIATVYHAGTTDDGLPFFAMEVVRGLPLIDYCDQHRLGIRRRLELFVQVCDAVQHAHQKMIVHRDLKPSNVLVAIEEGRPVPKLIDFGIAKCLEKPLTDNVSLVTHEGLPVGTPLYMSPEQIQGDLIDLDVRVDVYALGVLLYELLAGVQPMDISEMEPLQVMMRVLKEEMPPPSVRFSALGSELKAEITANHGDSEGSIVRELRGHLDWIVMRAMERDRARRYGSAAELGADVTRYLRDEPVVARPPSVAYRLGRFVHRNRVWVAAGLLVLAAMVAGLAVSTVATIRATRARDQARAAEQRANSTVGYLRKVLGSVDPGVDGRQVRVVDLLTKASEMISTDLADQPEVESAVRKTIGLTLLELGIFEESAPQLERTVELQTSILGRDNPETLHSINAVGRLLYKLGRYEEAARIHREVFDQQRRLLGLDNERTLWTMYHLAKALDKEGAWTMAEPLYRENVALRQRVFGAEDPDTLVAVNSMCLFLAVSGQLDEAERLQRASLDALRRHPGPEHPDTLRGEANLVEILNLEGRHAEAENLSRGVLENMTVVLGPEHPETLGVTGQLALAVERQGRPRDAEPLYRRVLALRRLRLGTRHPDTLETQVQLGENLAQLGNSSEAEQLITGALADTRVVHGEGHWRGALIEAAYGRLLLRWGREAEAEPVLRAAHVVLAEQHHPQARAVAGALATLYDARGRRAEATHYRELARG